MANSVIGERLTTNWLRIDDGRKSVVRFNCCVAPPATTPAPVRLWSGDAGRMGSSMVSVNFSNFLPSRV